MLVLVTYDVATSLPAGRRRLSRVARACEDFGVRVQKSVFECQLDAAQLAELRGRLGAIIDPAVDSLRFYRLGNHWTGKVEHVGAKVALDVSGPMIA
jgi:CRISPR-associated protein Cas2